MQQQQQPHLIVLNETGQTYIRKKQFEARTERTYGNMNVCPFMVARQFFETRAYMFGVVRHGA